MNRFSLVFIGGGTVVLALSLVMGWLGVPQMMNSQIKKGSRLIKGSKGYSMWKGPSPIPSLLKIYLFNVTNPKEVEEGGKPILEELGPYVYKQIKEKIDIKPGEIKNDTIQYRNLVWLHFSNEHSKGTTEDVITFINLPFVSVAKLAVNLTKEGQSLKDIDVKLTGNGESLFKKTSVQELLFEGFSVEPFINILNGETPSETTENDKIPELFRSGKFALFYGKNGSDDGIYEVDVGIRDFKDVGQIQAWNNYTSLPWWKHESCNNISNATDGTIFAPFIDRQSILATFSPDLCRRFQMIYDSDITFKGVPGLRFIWDKKIFLGPQENQENWCYCVELETDPKMCERNGVISLSSCSGGIPLWMSQPHFLGAEKSIMEGITGLNPDDKKHTTYVNIEPDTAIIFQAAKRFQMNIQLEQIKEMPTFSKVRNIMFPIMWVEESFELTDMQIFAQMKMIMDIVDQGRWILIVSSIGAVGIGIIVGMLKREKIK